MTFQEIKNKIAVSSKVDFGTIFNQSTALFKKTWTQGLIMFVLMFAIIIAVEMLLIIPIAIFSTASPFLESDFLTSLTFVGILLFVLLYLLIICFIITIANGMIAGLYTIYKKADHEELYSTGDFFTFLKKDKIIKTFTISLLQMLIILGFYIMCCLPVIYAAIPVSYIVVVYAFNPDLSVSEVIKLAFAIGNKNWFETFLLRLVASMVAMLGVFLCGVGIFATFAFVLIPQYFVYKQAIGFEDDSEINNIGLSGENYDDSTF